jgi:hypothetical protein
MDPKVRIGDSDRERAVADLQQYVTDGYLTLDEFSERSAAAYQAKTRGELVALTGDLAPRAELGRGPRTTGGAVGRSPWSLVAIVVVAVVGLVVVGVVVMILVMAGVMGGMGGMG